jgi:hypothetical protein
MIPEDKARLIVITTALCSFLLGLSMGVVYTLFIKGLM